MARLFTAVDLAPSTREALVAVQAELARALRGTGRGSLRMVGAAQLHMTLVFIGEVDDARVGTIADAMSLDLVLPAFDLEFGHCGVFPPHGPPRVLWIGVTRGAESLVDLFERVSERLETVGIPRERRPFTPHLTIARWRDGSGARVRTSLPPLGRVAAERVDAVTLFSSRLLPDGPEHTPLARARLAGSPPAA